MFENLEIQIYCFSPFLNSTLKLPRDWRGEGGCFALFDFSCVCVYSVTGFQLQAPCILTEKLSALDDSHRTWSQGNHNFE